MVFNYFNIFVELEKLNKLIHDSKDPEEIKKYEFFKFIIMGSLDDVERLLKARFPVESEHDDKTALFWSVYIGNMKMTELLLKYDADEFNVATGECFESHDVSFIRYLMESNRDLKIKDNLLKHLYDYYTNVYYNYVDSNADVDRFMTLAMNSEAKEPYTCSYIRYLKAGVA